MILGSEREKDKDERKSAAKRTHDDGLMWWWWLRFEVMLSVFISGSNYFFFRQPYMGGSHYNVLFSFLLRVRMSVESRGKTERKHGKKNTIVTIGNFKIY